MERSTPWPTPARGAVSLTYDDGFEEQIDEVAPALEDAGFRGTFYLCTENESIGRRKEDWRRLFRAGHEIGNHTARHPCREGIPSLGDYTDRMIREEVTDGAAWLDREIGEDPERTFAYPCGELTVGEPPESGPYLRAVREHHRAARTVEGGVNSPDGVRRAPLRLRANDPVAHCRDGPEPLIRLCERGVAEGGWVILIFHRIVSPGGGGGEGEAPSLDPSCHRELLDTLRAGPYWVAPVKTVVGRLLRRSQRGEAANGSSLSTPVSAFPGRRSRASILRE